MLRIGVAGIGNISKIYLDNLTCMFGKKVKLTGVTDVVFNRAEKAAAEYKVKEFKTLNEMLNSDNVDMVLNITPPMFHYEVAIASVKAGKHIYNEKPICTKREDAEELFKTAEEKGVRVGGAPDTFLGSGIQTCRKLLDDGWIGTPIAATAFIMNRGPEHWHPAPDYFYKDGAGPLFDLGPYYLTALICLLGPVSRVCGSARISVPERIITNQSNYGKKITVEVPTHIAGVLDFKNGAVGTIITSFDVYSHSLPFIEIYGTEGTLKVPDPNTFGGPVFVKRFREEEWSKVPLLKSFPDNSRGLGITEMATAIEAGRPHLASGELTFHVLDIMHSIQEASAKSRYSKIKSRCKRPEALVF